MPRPDWVAVFFDRILDLGGYLFIFTYCANNTDIGFTMADKLACGLTRPAATVDPSHSDTKFGPADSSLFSALAPAILEFLLWLVTAAVFLFKYVTEHAAPIAATLSHLELVATLWCAILSVRLAVWSWLPNERMARWCNASLITAAALTLVGYYFLVLAGLRSWGRVVSWKLIETYAPQTHHLLSALGVPPGITLAGVALVVCTLLASIALGPGRTDWVARAARSMSPQLVFVCVLAGLTLASLRLYIFVAYPPTRNGEPVSLTFFPEQATRPYQTHRIGGVPALDSAEDKERAAYVPGSDAVRRNVILIVGDALCPDHMSLNGYPRSTTPFLDSLKREGAMSKAAWVTAVCAESSCGLLAITRSKYVHQLSDRAFTLQEALKETLNKSVDRSA